METKSRLAIFALVAGLVCFLNQLGIEKAILAITAGYMALNEIQREGKKGKGLAWAGIGLGIAYIITITILGIIYWPQLLELIKHGVK